MITKCKDCKYFKRHDENDRYTKYRWNKYGQCTNEHIEYGESNYVGNIDAYSKRERVIATDYLLYQDYERYSADCEVGEDFGCIHFVKKKTEEKQ